VIEGETIVSHLETRRSGGATRDDLMKEAVGLIEAARQDYDWVGIYLLQDGVLVLDNYLGEETEHTRIAVGDGVCGTAVAEDRNLNIPDVNEIENYIACSIGTASELVVLMRTSAGDVVGQLDLDSDRPAAFDEGDERELGVVADWLGRLFDEG